MSAGAHKQKQKYQYEEQNSAIVITKITEKTFIRHFINTSLFNRANVWYYKPAQDNFCRSSYYKYILKEEIRLQKHDEKPLYFIPKWDKATVGDTTNDVKKKRNHFISN